jgi:hypothetical protein
LIGAELRDDRLETVVAASRSRPPDPQPPGLEVHVVDDDEQVLQRDLVEVLPPLNRRAAQVHERLRLHEDRVLAPPGDLGVRLPAPRRTVPRGQAFQDFEPDVMPRPRVFATRVAQTGNELHSARAT